MSRRLVALAIATAAAVSPAPAHAEEVCAGSVCANAPYCVLACYVDKVLDFQCTDDVQVVCTVRDIVRG